MADLQWGIFRADLNPVKGSEQAGTRPVVVVTREALNKTLPIIGICLLTSLKPGRRVYPTEVFLAAALVGIAIDSLMLAHQFRTISKERLGANLGRVSDPLLQQQVRRALSIFLDLG